METNKEFEMYFSKIYSIEDFLLAEENGFSANFITQRAEMPGASFFHEVCRCCKIELIIFIYENRKVDLNYLDLDECSPLGYLINDDLFEEMTIDLEVKTVNLGCEDPLKIYNTIKYLLSIGCKSIYCGKEYDQEFVFYYIKRLQNFLKG